MRFGILGPLQVLGDDGREVPVPGRMPRALLALLLLRPNEVIPSDRLVEELWAGAPPASGTKGLHVHVSRLRHGLAAGGPDTGEERVITTAGGYLLQVGPDELDAAQGERLIAEGRSLVAAGRLEQAVAAFSAALALWRGTGLSDFQYEAFAQPDVARLSELRAAVLEERIAAQVLLGRDAEVIGELESLVREYPYRERLHGQLMLLCIELVVRRRRSRATVPPVRYSSMSSGSSRPRSCGSCTRRSSRRMRRCSRAMLQGWRRVMQGPVDVVSESPSTSRHVRLPAPRLRSSAGQRACRAGRAR